MVKKGFIILFVYSVISTLFLSSFVLGCGISAPGLGYNFKFDVNKGYCDNLWTSGYGNSSIVTKWAMSPNVNLSNIKNYNFSASYHGLTFSPNYLIDGKDIKICANGTKPGKYYGKIFLSGNGCGAILTINLEIYECSSDKCDGFNYIFCNNHVPSNQGLVKGKCLVECLSVLDCQPNFLCTNYKCTEIGKINVFRFSKTENKCYSLNIYPSEKTTDDYDTLAECQSKIVTNPPANNTNTTIPPVQECPSGQTKCSDGVCRTSCESPNPGTFVPIIIAGVVFVLYLLYFFIYKWKK